MRPSLTCECSENNLASYNLYTFECLVSLYNIVIKFTFVSGTAGFFLKHVQTGMCINDTRIIHSRGSWGNLSFVELSNNCLDPAAQFRFLDNGAMLNLERPGCLYPTHKHGFGYSLDMFYLYVNYKGLDTEACRERVDRNTDPAITPTSWGPLSVKYTRDKRRTPETMCVVPKTDERLANSPGIDPYIGWTRDCTDTEDKRFNFGKFLFRFVLIDTCHAPRGTCIEFYYTWREHANLCSVNQLKPKTWRISDESSRHLTPSHAI